MTTKRPKPEDFIDAPVTNDERLDALNRLVEREVMAERARKYNRAKEAWEWKNVMGR